MAERNKRRTGVQTCHAKHLLRMLFLFTESNVLLPYPEQVGIHGGAMPPAPLNKLEEERPLHRRSGCPGLVVVETKVSTERVFSSTNVLSKEIQEKDLSVEAAYPRHEDQLAHPHDLGPPFNPLSNPLEPSLTTPLSPSSSPPLPPSQPSQCGLLPHLIDGTS